MTFSAKLGVAPFWGGASLLQKISRDMSESVSTGVWCVPGFGAGFEIALKPSNLLKEGENPGQGRFDFLRQSLVYTKPRGGYPGSKEIRKGGSHSDSIAISRDMGPLRTGQKRTNRDRRARIGKPLHMNPVYRPLIKLQ